MRITTIELDIRELLFLLTHDNLQREADRQQNIKPGGIVNDKPEEKPAEAGEEIKPASQVKKPSIPVVERPAYEPKPQKKRSSFDTHVDVCKLDADGNETEWITCDNYNKAASKIGCHFTSVMQALKEGRERVKDHKVRWHIPRPKQPDKK